MQLDTRDMKTACKSSWEVLQKYNFYKRMSIRCVEKKKKIIHFNKFTINYIHGSIHVPSNHKYVLSDLNALCYTALPWTMANNLEIFN